MARWRFLAVALLALAFAGNPTQTGRTAGQGKWTDRPSAATVTTPAAADNGSCTIYALADMGYDSDLGQWIAQTIPEMIEPNSWQAQGGIGALRYYAPKNILIIKHSEAVHAKVNDFLRDLKKSLPKESERSSATGKKTPRANIVPAAYQAPALLRTSGPLPEASSYPVPAPVKPPKHLFHFLIRYEGEGIIDDNVVKYFKVTNQSQKTEKSETPASDPSVEPRYLTHPPTYVPPSPLYPGTVIKENDTKGKEDKKDDEKGSKGKEP